VEGLSSPLSTSVLAVTDPEEWVPFSPADPQIVCANFALSADVLRGNDDPTALLPGVGLAVRSREGQVVNLWFDGAGATLLHDKLPQVIEVANVRAGGAQADSGLTEHRYWAEKVELTTAALVGPDEVERPAIAMVVRGEGRVFSFSIPTEVAVQMMEAFPALIVESAEQTRRHNEGGKTFLSGPA
jgi:hypothetical protein